ncbi:hypothetical protein GCM10023193_45420 [Planotetraspora kaengkrachanensis]|uniref:Uncharacterized protein n=1 Tax=Planotetraspora kaengkrachanensis TaxID=575193 RepID=A0A8J3Q0A7_9ACTN|nr:hypothetical protein Pka01_73720 [Planotetraspora kaengkrachanensis]
MKAPIHGSVDIGALTTTNRSSVDAARDPPPEQAEISTMSTASHIGTIRGLWPRRRTW